MEKTKTTQTEQPKPSFGARIKETAQRLLSKVNSMLHREPEAHEGEIFVERRQQRPFLLAVLFTTLKIMLVCVVVLGCAGLGLVLGVAKAYIDTTPELDVSLLTKSERTSYIYDMDGKLITTYAGLKYRDWVNIEDVPDMLINAVIAVEAAGGDAQVQRELLARVSVMLRQANGALTDLREKQAHAASLSGEAQARAYYETVCPAMETLRAPVDHLEMIVDSRLWPMPTYGELLFGV